MKQGGLIMAVILQQNRQLLFDNLNLIMRHRQEILNTPRYANIDAHYALRGGGAYVGAFTFRKQLVVAGKPVTVNLTLKSLLSIWVMAAFKVMCKCGETAYICSFAGSPLSGVAVASAYCPYCKNEIHGIKGRTFKTFVAPLERTFANEEATVSQAITSGVLDKVVEPCSLETMIQELKLKEYEAAQDAKE